MSDQRPSNPLVTRLRSGKNCAEGGGKCRMMEARSGCECAQAADEIERLTAELADAKRERDVWVNELRDLQGEAMKVNRERDRLLALLDKIALIVQEHPCGHGKDMLPWCACCRVSYALAGAADETSERCKHGVWAADHCYQCAAENGEGGL